MPEPKYITLDEAAALLAVHKLTIRRAIDSGRLPAYRMGTRRGVVRVDQKDVLALLEPITPAGARQ